MTGPRLPPNRVCGRATRLLDEHGRRGSRDFAHGHQMAANGKIGRFS